MKRIFAFGCSFTKYHYPTWADIIISNGIYDESYNMGRSGAGNQYIVTKLWEANALYNFCETDTILIGWTYFGREDRYIEDSGWHTPGNSYQFLQNSMRAYNNYICENDFIWYNPLHFAMRDCMLITSTKLALQQLKVNIIDAQVCSYESFKDINHMKDTEMNRYPLGLDDVPFINGMYDNYLKTCLGSIVSSYQYPGLEDDTTRPSWTNDQMSFQNKIESHPLPIEHLKFVEDSFIGVNYDTRKWVHSWQDYIQQNSPIHYPLAYADNYNTNMGWSG